MKRPSRSIAVLGAICLTACAGNPGGSDPPAAPAAIPPGPAPGSVSAPRIAADNADSVPAIARREVIRRQEMIRQMDEAALRASQRLAEDDLEGAVDGYRRAIGQ